jgi:DNA-binding CsgD family transcriptional regulator
LKSAVPELAAQDAERLLRFVAEAQSIGGDQLFTPDLFVELGRLVPADDFVGYQELDLVRRREFFSVQRDGQEEYADDDKDDVLWNIVVVENPVCRRRWEGCFEALKLSDFLSRKELHRTRFYDLWLRPWGVEYGLSVAIPSPPWHTKTFAFSRTGNRDFTERDRLVLDVLQPHLARLWRAARTRRLLRSALAELDRVDEHSGRGVILLGPGEEVEFASAPARRLLREFFPGVTADRLPAALEEWLGPGATSPLISRSGARQLSVDRADDALLLEERREEVGLTAREREVLAWVARGKTNAQIARLLWLAPGTVGKHLEHVYAKLGVSTRTAAVTRFLGLIDAEAS